MDEILLLDFVILNSARGAYDAGAVLQVTQVTQRAIEYVLSGDDEPITVNIETEPGIITKTTPSEGA